MLDIIYLIIEVMLRHKDVILNHQNKKLELLLKTSSKKLGFLVKAINLHRQYFHNLIIIFPLNL